MEQHDEERVHPVSDPGDQAGERLFAGVAELSLSGKEGNARKNRTRASGRVSAGWSNARWTAGKTEGEKDTSQEAHTNINPEAHDQQHNSAPISRLARAPLLSHQISVHTTVPGQKEHKTQTQLVGVTPKTAEETFAPSLSVGGVIVLFVKLRNMYVYTSVKTKTNPRLTLKMAKNCCVMVPSSSGLQHPQMSNTSNVEPDHRF